MNNFKNYFVYADAVQNKTNFSIYVPSITIENINEHIDAIYAILKDGIETEYVHNLLVNVSWGGDLNCDLFIIDYWFNLFMWKMILNDGEMVRPKHIFWSPDLRRKNISNFINKYVLTRENKIRLGNAYLNNNIYDATWLFSYTETFAYYLANTINNEDFIDMMNNSQEFYDYTHFDFSKYSISDAKAIGVKLTDRIIELIKNSKDIIGYNHGLEASFRANEAISDRQFQEVLIGLITKPTIDGNIFPYIIGKSFINGGVNDLVSYYIESTGARKAQDLSKNSMGDSGAFARLLNLNNSDTTLNKNMNYECMPRHFIRFEIKSDKHLSMIKNRYYRFTPRGMEYLIDTNDKSLIGKVIYLRSPCTCTSFSSGFGICKKCYGDLYYTNIDINVGTIASEIPSSQMSQRLLSSKHLLEPKPQDIKWNPEFNMFFDMDTDTVTLADIAEEFNLKKYYLVIDPEDIVLVNEEQDTIATEDIKEDSIENYNEYITHFGIRTPSGEVIDFKTQNQDSLYITTSLNVMIRKKANPFGGLVNIALANIQDIPLFYIQIANDELTKSMKDIKNAINKKSVIDKFDKDSAVQTLVDLVIAGNLNVDAIHLEVIIANQIRSAQDILKKPDWSAANPQYKILTLDQSLINNPSVIVSLLFGDLRRTLYNPLTYAKHEPSFFDLFFCERPQVYMNGDLIDDNPPIPTPEKGVEMVSFIKPKDS